MSAWQVLSDFVPEADTVAAAGRELLDRLMAL